MNPFRPAQIFYANTHREELSHLGRFVEGFNQKAAWVIEAVGVIGAVNHRPAYLLFTAAGIALNHFTNKRIKAHKRAEWYRQFPNFRAPMDYLEGPSLGDLFTGLKEIAHRDYSKTTPSTAAPQ